MLFTTKTYHLKYSPVPVQNDLHIKHRLDQDLYVQLVSMDGKIVMEQTQITRDEQLNLSSLQSGLYFAQFLDENGSLKTVKKIIKK